MDIPEYQQAKVFISYTRNDRTLMKNFKDQLLSDQAIKQAANIWYDKELTPGRQWNEEIF